MVSFTEMDFVVYSLGCSNFVRTHHLLGVVRWILNYNFCGFFRCVSISPCTGKNFILLVCGRLGYFLECLIFGDSDVVFVFCDNGCHCRSQLFVFVSVFRLIAGFTLYFIFVDGFNCQLWVITFVRTDLIENWSFWSWFVYIADDFHCSQWFFP